jgi:L-alanine-DL-glutamate epimerase-like enolase superfamily enzyme
MVEYMPRSAAILQTLPTLEKGELVVPQTPGLGLDLDEAAVRRYRVGEPASLNL